MKPEDVLALMDMENPADADGDDVVTDAGGGAKAVVESATVLKLDRWSVRKGKELMEDPDVAAAVVAPAAVGEDGKPKPKVKPLTEKEKEFWANAMADFHAAAFELRPEAADNPADEMRSEFLTQLMETDEFQEMRVSTCLQPVAAELAATCFAKQFAVRRAEAARDEAQGKPGGSGGDGDLKTMQAAAKAISDAAAAVGDYRDAVDACGMGGPGTGAAGRMDAKRLTAAYHRIKKSPRLAAIAKMAGRFRRLAQSKQRQKVTHGADEVVGVTLGDEIAKLVPAELAKLVDPTFKLDTYRRLMDQQTLCREMKATEPVGKGPIVVTVDESGSMQGPKIETAKALALALAWIARKQKRWCALLGFSGGCKIEPTSLLVIPPGKTDETALLAWLEHFYGQGTTLDVPLCELPKLWPQLVAAGMGRGRTDIIMITDAEVRVPPALEKGFLAFKLAEKVKLSVLVVEGQPGNIATVADDVFLVPAISTTEEAVGRILSI